ncbi:MAG: hypothetical protein IJ424_00355 [Oscillospiraceae bacterium]|nr:hypothetical protein [Oscillospiraceae bacterium]
MTKRIFAIVLALVMSLSLFTIEAFAAISVNATATGTNVSVSWSKQTGASKYSVELTNASGTVRKTETAGLTATFNELAAGQYNVIVTALSSTNSTLAANSTSVTVASTTNTPSTSGGVFNNGTNLSWAPVEGATGYNLVFYKGTSVSGTSTTTEQGIYISSLPTGVTKVDVYAQTATGSTLVGSATLATTGTTGTGTVYVNGQYIVWTDTVSTTYNITFYGVSNNVLATYKGISTKSITVTAAPTGTSYVVVTRANGTSVGSCSLTGTGSTGSITSGNVYITAKSDTTVTIGWSNMGASLYYVKYTNKITGETSTVPAVTAGATLPLPAYTSIDVEITIADGLYKGQKITATVSGTGVSNITGGLTGTGTTTGNLYINKGTTSSTVTWAPVTGATFYQVSYKKYSDTNATTLPVLTTTSATIPLGSKDTWTVTVTALLNGTFQIVGTATVAPTSSSTVTGTTTTTGQNCTVVSNATTSTVTWVGGIGTYTVVYTPDGKTASTLTTYTNTIQIPVGHSTNFSVYVIANNQIVATANVKKATTGSTTTVTKTEIQNLTLDSTAFKTKVSWNKVTGADYYYIEYSYLGAGAGENTVTTAASVEIPFGKNTNFNVTVYAIDGSKTTKIGYANHVAGSSADDDDIVADNDTDVTVTEDTVTGFWAETLGDGVVKLTWNAVEDADNYKVYYRKVGATKWSGGHTRTKTYLSIDFGSKTSTYEFKIVAGDEESTVLTLKPSAAKGTVAWAADPDSDAAFETNLAGVVKDADEGKITLTWDEVANAKYTVYYRKAGTTTWKGAYERSGESITITFKSANIDNTYEIMIKAGSKASDVFTLKPAVWANAD